MARQHHTTLGGLAADVFEPDGAPKATIVLCHGIWVGGWIWEDFATYLADHGYFCCAPSWRGRYDSKLVEDLGKVSVLDFVEDVKSVYEAAGGHVLIGESAGGLYAMKAAEGLQNLKALVLMNPAPPFRVPPRPRLVAKQLKYLPDLVFGRPNKPKEKDYRDLILNNVSDGEAKEFYKKICADSGRAISQMSNGKVKVDPARIKCPVHVIIGHLDAILPVGAMRRVAEMFAAEVTEYPSMSHHTFSETGWEKVADELLAWLDEKLKSAG